MQQYSILTQTLFKTKILQPHLEQNVLLSMKLCLTDIVGSKSPIQDYKRSV